MLANELDFCRKVLRVSNGLPYHAYSRSSGVNRDKRTVACRRVVVDSSYNLSIDPKPYFDQNVLKDAYSLMYRSCPGDSSSTRVYFFGDVCLTVNDKTKAIKGLDYETFCENICTAFPAGVVVPDYLTKFKNAVSNKIFLAKFWDFINGEVDRLFKDRKLIKAEGLDKLTAIYVYFDLSEPLGVNQWHQMPDCIPILDSYMLQLTKDDTFIYENKAKGYTLTKSLLSMLTSGDKKSDNQFVGFNIADRYKSYSIGEEDLRLLFYHRGILNALGIHNKNSKPYGIKVIPSGDFGDQEAMDFLQCLSTLQAKSAKEQEEDSEGTLESAESQVQDDGGDPLEEPDNADISEDPADVLEKAVSSTSRAVTSFDVLVVNEGGKVPVNVSEINNVGRSQLLKNLKHISAVGSTVQNTFKSSYRPTLFRAFYNIHRSIKKGEKYQGKFMKFMTRILTGTYYGDPDLSRIYVELILKTVRDGKAEKYLYGLKISYEYLKQIEKKGATEMVDEKAEEHVKAIEDLGRQCAKIAWPLSFVIKAFEKSQVGYMKRRARDFTSVSDLATEYLSRVALHKGERAGDIRIDSDSVSYANHTAQEIVKKLVSEKAQFDSDAFVRGFVDQFYIERYRHNKINN